MHGANVILTLFAQIAMILALSRLLGWLFSRRGQAPIGCGDG
jgi:Kef-type K+ transport system membrane component KefB